MSWLVEGAATQEDLLALHPGLAADHRQVVDEIWQGCVDPKILELCRLRMATLLGNERVWNQPRTAAAVAAGLDAALVDSLAQWPTDARFDDTTRMCLRLAEQYVIDVHGITDELVAQLAAAIGPDGVVTLTTALATWEITHRFDNALLDAMPTGEDPA